MWSQNRNYWKDSRDGVPEDEGEAADHAHCNGCYKIKCQHKSKTSCSPMHCPLSCGAVFHSCKANEHKELCGKEIVPCVNAFYGCKQSMRRSERGQHLATCPASVVYCTMEWNRWPVFSRERQERVPFAQKNLHARYGQLDVALAMRDQRILYEAMKAPRRVRRSLRNRLTERFPAVPLTSSHSSYVEGGSVDATIVTSDEDGGGGDAPWDLSRDPPGLQRSICKELFKTDSGSLHLDALDAHVRERNGSEKVDRSAFESGQTTSCSSFDQKDLVSTSVTHLEACDMVGLPVGEGHICGSNGVPILAGGDINAFSAGEFALVNRPTNLSKLGDKASEEFGNMNESFEKKTTEGSTCGTEFHSVHSVFVSSQPDKTAKTTGQNERVSDMETDKTPSGDDSRSLSVENSCSAVEASINADGSTDAGKVKVGSELPDGGSNDCQAMMTDSSESLEFLPDLVFLGIDVACVSSLHHHNAVVFLPPTGGTIANPGTVVVDLPKEYHGSSVPPPTIPPPLTLQQILALDLNLESITRYQAKPRSMYTFLCAQNFRRDEYPWHFKNVHSDIHGGLSGWIEARCPLACYGCTYSTRRLNPANGTVLYNSEVDCFGVRPNSSHLASLLGEFCDRPSQASAQKEATPEIYTSKDYDSAVNIKRRSYAEQDELLQGERSSQMGFTSERDVTSQNKDTSADNHRRNKDRDFLPPSDDPSKFEAESKGAIAEGYNTADVFPSCSDLSRDTRAGVPRDSYSSAKDIRGASLDRDSMTSSSDTQCLDESLLLRVLPFEVIQHIARCLDSFSLCNLAMTSHFLREVCRSIVEHRGIVIQEWEKKQFDSGSSWQVTYQRWLFSSAFTPCNEWRFEESPSVSEHLKVCPFNVMAEPRSQPFQLCCLSMSEDVYRNLEAERILQKMYPEFNPQSIPCEDSSSRMPGAEVLDHLYVNEIGKSGFSGYKRALKSFAQSCSEQFRDTPDDELGIETSEQFGESLEPKMAIETLEEFEEYLELETNTSEQFEDFQEPKPETLSTETFRESFVLKLETKSSEQFATCLEPKLKTDTSEPFEDSLEPKLETMTAEKSGGLVEAELKIITSELVEDHLEANQEAKASEQTMESKTSK